MLSKIRRLCCQITWKWCVRSRNTSSLLWTPPPTKLSSWKSTGGSALKSRRSEPGTEKGSSFTECRLGIRTRYYLKIFSKLGKWYCLLKNMFSLVCNGSSPLATSSLKWFLGRRRRRSEDLSSSATLKVSASDSSRPWVGATSNLFSCWSRFGAHHSNDLFVSFKIWSSHNCRTTSPWSTRRFIWPIHSNSSTTPTIS